MTIIVIILNFLTLVLFKDSTFYTPVLVLSSLLFVAAFVVDIFNIRVLAKYKIPLVLACVIRVFLCAYDGFGLSFLHLPLVGGTLSSDPYHFYQTAILYMNGGTSSYGGIFPRVLAGVFTCCGTSRLLADYFVTIFALATIVVFAYILEKFELPYKASSASMYLISLLPNFILLSCVIRRETIISFFVSLSLLCFIDWVLYDKKSKLGIAAVFALCASAFHGAVGLIIVVYIFALIIYDPGARKFNMKGENIFLAFILILLFIALYSVFGSTFFSKLDRLSDGNVSSVRDSGGSNYAKYVGDASTPLRMIIYQIPRFLYYMFSPFPWDWRGFSDLFAFVFSSAVYMLILYRSIKYIRTTPANGGYRSTLIILLICVAFVACIFSWGVTNTGTATRHRDKLIVFFALMYALTYGERGEKYRKHGVVARFSGGNRPDHAAIGGEKAARLSTSEMAPIVFDKGSQNKCGDATSRRMYKQVSDSRHYKAEHRYRSG